MHVRVGVTGGRDYSDAEAVSRNFKATARVQGWSVGSIIVINGAAPGLDTLVQQYCKSHGIACANVPANWDFYGNAAGPVRNAWMLILEPRILMAFPGGKGTADMTSRAIKAGVGVVQCS